MKRLLLILAFYVLASVGAQAQVINPDGLKEMWVNDSISSEIYFSPDSSAFFHAYFEKYPPEDEVHTILLFKRDLMTNQVLQKKRIYYPYDGKSKGAEPPLMALSPDGRFLVLIKTNTMSSGGGKAYNTDTLFVYDQQSLELIREIPVSLEEVIDPYYDAEKFKYVFIQQFENPIFLDNERFIFGAYFTDRYLVPIEVPNHVGGYASCIYNIQTGDFIEETAYTKRMQDTNMFRFVAYKKTTDGKYVLGKGFINNYPYCMTFETNNLDNYRIHNIDLNILDGYYRFNQDGTKIIYCLNDLTTSYFGMFDLLNDKEELLLDISENRAGGRPIIFKNNKYITIRKDLDEITTVLFDLNSKDIYLLSKRLYFSEYLIEDKNLLLFSEYDPELVSNFNYQPKTARLVRYDLDIILSVDELESNENTIYPNPGEDIVNITNDNDYYEYKIIDALGKAVLNGDISYQKVISIDISSLTSGTYFVNLYSNNTTTSLKLIKNK